MREGVTKTGFRFSLEDDAMDNMELVEELASMQENDLVAITRVVTMVFGPDQKKALYDHLRTQEGRVKVSTVMGDLAKAYVQIVPSARGMKEGLTSIVNGEMPSGGKSAGGIFGSNLVGKIKSVITVLPQ